MFETTSATELLQCFIKRENVHPMNEQAEVIGTAENDEKSQCEEKAGGHVDGGMYRLFLGPISYVQIY